MSLKNVIRAFSLLRQLTDDEAALLNTLRSLNDGERELLVESLSPGKKATTRKTTGKSTTKSRRASELSDTLRQRTAGRTTVNSDDEAVCTYEFPDSNGTHCGEKADDNVHHLQSDLLFHPFASSSPASRVAGKSSPNGEGGSSTPGTATGLDAAPAVTRAASGGE